MSFSTPAKHELGLKIIGALDNHPYFHDFLWHLRAAPSAMVVGGAVRDLLISIDGQPRDLDVVVEDGDLTIVEKLCEVFPNEKNKYGNWRFFLQPEPHMEENPLHADLWSPGRFDPPMADVVSMLKWFDLSINALAVRIADCGMLNPVDGMSHLAHDEIWLQEEVWKTRQGDELEYMSKRLNRLKLRYPQLKVKNPNVLDEAFGTLPLAVDSTGFLTSSITAGSIVAGSISFGGVTVEPEPHTYTAGETTFYVEGKSLKIQPITPDMTVGFTAMEIDDSDYWPDDEG